MIDEAYVDFGGESAVPLIADYPTLLVVQRMSMLAGLRVGYALSGGGLLEALHRVKNGFILPARPPRPGGRDGFGSRRRRRIDAVMGLRR